jgi:hypothetical protein
LAIDLAQKTCGMTIFDANLGRIDKPRVQSGSRHGREIQQGKNAPRAGARERCAVLGGRWRGDALVSYRDNDAQPTTVSPSYVLPRHLNQRDAKQCISLLVIATNFIRWLCDSRLPSKANMQHTHRPGTLAIAMIFAAAPLAGIHMLDGRLASALLRSGQLELVVMLLFAGATVQIVGTLLSGIAYSSASSRAGPVRLHPLLKDVIVNATSIAAFAYVAWVAIIASPKL